MRPFHAGSRYHASTTAAKHSVLRPLIAPDAPGYPGVTVAALRPSSKHVELKPRGETPSCPSLLDGELFNPFVVDGAVTRDSDQARATRAAARSKRAVLHRSRLGDAGVDFDPVTGAAAVALVAELTRRSWSLAGRELPRYERSEIPCRFVRGRLT